MTVPAFLRVVASIRVLRIAAMVFHLGSHGAVKDLGGKCLEDTILAKHIGIWQYMKIDPVQQKMDHVFIFRFLFGHI